LQACAARMPLTALRDEFPLELGEFGALR
jgi:hypothetical protein